MLGPAWQRFLPAALALGCAAAAVTLRQPDDRLAQALIGATLLIPLLSPWILHGPLRRLRSRARAEWEGGNLLLDGRQCLILRVVGRDGSGRTVAAVRRGKRDVLGAFPFGLPAPPSAQNVALGCGSAWPRWIALSTRVVALSLVLALLSNSYAAAALVAWLLWPILIIAYIVLALDAFSFTPTVIADPAPRAWVGGAWVVLRGPLQTIEKGRRSLVVRGATTVRIAASALDEPALDRLALFLRDALKQAAS